MANPTDARRRNGKVTAIISREPLVLEVASQGEGSAGWQIEFPCSASAEMLEQIEREVLGQTVEYVPAAWLAPRRCLADVWYFRPVEEDDEVEYVYRVSLNAELARSAAPPSPKPDPL